jgi:hypothetical protein
MLRWSWDVGPALQLQGQVERPWTARSTDRGTFVEDQGFPTDASRSTRIRTYCATDRGSRASC